MIKFLIYLTLILLLIDIGSVSSRPKIFNKSPFKRSNKTARVFNSSDIDLWVEWEEIVFPYTDKAVDLGMGFPNYMPPKHLVQAMKTVANNDTWQIHQYARTKGEIQLVVALSHLYSKLMQRKIDPMNEILVTAGAMQALYFVAMSYINPGDEVIVFEPYYQAYDSVIRLAGGTPVFVRLKTKDGKQAKTSADLTFDEKELDKKFNKRTKMIWVNNPNNPSGKSYTKAELLKIGKLAEKHDVIVLADEVAQFYHFEGPEHVRFVTLPGMWKRTMTVNSGGKTFSNTGWRIGWLIGPEELLWAVTTSLSANICAVPTVTQIAFAIGIEIENKLLGKKESYYNWVKGKAKHMRDKFIKIFKKYGIDSTIPHSGYFLIADFKKYMNKMDLSKVDDKRIGFALPKWLLTEADIFVIPLSVFYSDDNKHSVENKTRICFLKDDKRIDEFDAALKKLVEMGEKDGTQEKDEENDGKQKEETES